MGDDTEPRAVVETFLAAARADEPEALIALLHPDAVLEIDGAPERAAVPKLRRCARLALFAAPALVRGLPGFLVAPRGRPIAAAAFGVEDGRIVRVELLTDPFRLGTAEFSFLAG